MSDGLCLTVLLNQAESDLLAAQLEYADTVARFPLTDDERQVLYSLFLGSMSIEDANAALTDASRVAAVYRSKNRLDYVSSQVKQFKASPSTFDYRNADFAIPHKFYEQARRLKTPPCSPKVPDMPKKKTSSLNFDVIFRKIGIGVSCFLGIVGASNLSEKLGSFDNLSFVVLSCVVFASLLIPPSKDR